MKANIHPLTTRLGELPVVILPLEEYEKMKEDLEMLQSKTLAGKIKKAREEVIRGKIYSVNEVKKILNLS